MRSIENCSIFAKLNELKLAHDNLFHKDPVKKSNLAINSSFDNTNKASEELYFDALKRMEKKRVTDIYVILI